MIFELRKANRYKNNTHSNRIVLGYRISETCREINEPSEKELLKRRGAEDAESFRFVRPVPLRSLRLWCAKEAWLILLIERY